MVVKDSEKRFSLFREIRWNIFPKSFTVTNRSWIKTSEKCFPRFFVKSAAVIFLLFKILLINFAIHLVNKITFPKYDRFIMAFFKVLVIYGACACTVQRFSLRVHVCLKLLRKLFQNGRILLQIVLKVYSEDPD